MSTKAFASVWDAIEDDPAVAANMKLRSELMIALEQHIVTEGLGRAEAAKLYGITQSRLDALNSGKINEFSLDDLVSMVGAAGLQVRVKIEKLL